MPLNRFVSVLWKQPPDDGSPLHLNLRESVDVALSRPTAGGIGGGPTSSEDASAALGEPAEQERNRSSRATTNGIDALYPYRDNQDPSPREIDQVPDVEPQLDDVMAVLQHLQHQPVRGLL